MKKNILAFLLLSLIVAPGLVLAEGETVADDGVVNVVGQELTDVNIDLVLNNLRNVLLGVLLAFASIMLLWAGFSFVTAGGDANKASAAREKILYALIGIVVGLVSIGLISLVRSLLTNATI